jgi:hypothetical protein
MLVARYALVIVVALGAAGLREKVRPARGMEEWIANSQGRNLRKLSATHPNVVNEQNATKRFSSAKLTGRDTLLLADFRTARMTRSSTEFFSRRSAQRSKSHPSCTFFLRPPWLPL